MRQSRCGAMREKITGQVLLLIPGGSLIKEGGQDELGIVWADSVVDSHLRVCQDFRQMHA